ncbi:hypothetical protein [Streptomyces sp. NPDC060022]|uniref:hypothetical protein n=1 Tax=Streptomyces sp. NPDC060022 TaxID=3347039 RepID=UPI0036B4A3F1
MQYADGHMEWATTATGAVNQLLTALREQSGIDDYALPAPIRSPGAHQLSSDGTTWSDQTQVPIQSMEFGAPGSSAKVFAPILPLSDFGEVKNSPLVKVA